MATDNNKGKKPAEEAPSGKQKRLSRPKKEKEEEEEEEKTSKSSVRKSCKLLKEEKNVEGSSSGGGRSSSGKTRAMKVMLNIPAHRVDTMDSGEWVKFDQSGSPDHHRPSWCYYRCKYFSQGWPVEKHVKQSRNYQPTFDVSITKHNHPLPGHRGTSTSKSTSARKTTGKMHHNISADRVDTLDEGEWEKCAPRKEHPNSCYYRCKNFSQDCLAEKHVEPSRKNQPTFDVTYTSHRHNHRLTGSSTSKLTSLPPKSAERSAKGSSSTSRTSSPPKSTERSAKGKSSSTSRSSSPPKSTERSAKGKSSSTSKSSSPPKSTERSAKGKSSSTSKSSSPPKSAKRSAEGKSSSTSKSSSPPKSAKRSAEGKSSSTFKSSSPPKSAKRSGKGSKTSSPPKSAE